MRKTGLALLLLATASCASAKSEPFHLIPGAVRGGSEIIATVNRCVVDQNVYAAPLLNHLARYLLHSQSICNRNLEAECASLVSFDYGRSGCREILARVVVESNVSALAREHVTKRGANPTRAAGYESAFTFEQ